MILLVGPGKTRDIDIKFAFLSNIFHILLNGLERSNNTVSAKTIYMLMLGQREYNLLKLLVSAELTVQPVGQPVVIVVQHGGPQEVGHELRKCRPLDVLDLVVHVVHVDRVLLHVSPSGDAEDVGGVHLVAPVGLPTELKLVSESGDQTIERVSDECETEGGVE